MEKIVVITLGNRDLQFKKSIQKQINSLEKNWLEENNDDKNCLVITKKMNFYEITSKIYEENYEKWKKYFVFTMIEKTLSFVKAKSENTKIFFLVTHQNPTDKQDTYFVGLIAQKYYESKGYECELVEMDCNPTHFSELVNFYLKLYEKLPIESKIFISNSGGTPDIRSASYFAGIFRNYEFLNINARTNEVNTQNFKIQEKLILKSIVKQMLNSYNYQGIISLPLPEHIQNIAKEALNYYNLNKTIKGNYGEKAQFAINLLIQTAKVCYVQGRYAEALGRIYRIEEAIWHFLFYSYIKNKNWIDENDKVLYGTKKKNFDYLFTDQKVLKEFLKYHFPNIFSYKDNQLILITSSQSIPVQTGKNFYWYFFKHFNVYSSITSFFEKININSQNEPYKSDSVLNTTRNKSYLGHGFKGVTKKDLENIFQNFEKFLDNLNELLKIEIPTYSEEKIFDIKNQQILEALEKKE